MRTKISVTQNDIDDGVRSSRQTCPIANAVHRYTGDKVMVFGDVVLFAFPDEATLPRSAQRFIKRFDEGEPVEPFNFFLNIP